MADDGRALGYLSATVTSDSGRMITAYPTFHRAIDDALAGLSP